MNNVQLAKDIYAAFGRGDIPTVLAGFHPEIEWRMAEGAQVCHVLRFQSGKMTSFQQYLDTGQVQRVMAAG